MDKMIADEARAILDADLARDSAYLVRDLLEYEDDRDDPPPAYPKQDVVSWMAGRVSAKLDARDLPQVPSTDQELRSLITERMQEAALAMRKRRVAIVATIERASHHQRAELRKIFPDLFE